MNKITEYHETGLNEHLATAIARLASRSFTSSGRPIEERVAEMLQAVGSDDPEKTSGRRFVMWQDEQQEKAIAHSRTFIRHVFVGEKEIPVLALATVCTDPDLRGHGLGVAVTKAAFQQVGRDGWPDVCLFQSPVPLFYEKLNSRIVENRFVNRLNVKDAEANPWRDPTVMIYPQAFSWPEGVVDLNGPDY